jgi:hypothetical protein
VLHVVSEVDASSLKARQSPCIRVLEVKIKILCAVFVVGRFFRIPSGTEPVCHVLAKMLDVCVCVRACACVCMLCANAFSAMVSAISSRCNSIVFE